MKLHRSSLAGSIQVAFFAAAAAVSTSSSLTAVAAAAAESESSLKIDVKDRIRGAYYGALVADALCLGSHYEYDAHKINQAYNGTIEKYMAPGEHMGGQTHGVGWGARNYHPGTIAGDQTDYGEYNVLVLEHLANNNKKKQSKKNEPFDIKAFIPHWQERLTNGKWKQWVCTQTKQTYQQIQQKHPLDRLGGNSNAMALRYASMYAMYDTEESIVDAARKTMFTHRERTAILGNEFFARSVFRIVHHPNDDTLNLRQIFKDVARDMNESWISQKVQQAFDKYEEATNPDSSLYKDGGEYVDDLALTSMARLWDVGKSEPIKVGKASPTEGTLPGSIYFVLKYFDSDDDESGLMKASKANAMVGGDNASRSIAIGMVLGAAEGVNAIPTEFRDGLNHWKHSNSMLESLPLLALDDNKNNNEEL